MGGIVGPSESHTGALCVCGRSLKGKRPEARYCSDTCRGRAWRTKEAKVDQIQLKHLKALAGADVNTSILLKVARVSVAEMARRADVDYSVAWRICNRPISQALKRPASRRVCREIQERLGFELWPDLTQ